MAPKVTFVAHTHWDREWYHPFEVFRARLVEILDEALNAMERDPRLHFTLDGHVALVDDYLEMRPAAEPRLRALVKSGRLHVGPFYTQADSLLTDGEALLRNLAWGVRRADELGGHMPVGYMADQFGHAAQMPQLFRLLGIEAAVLWRGIGPERPPHAFKWIGPDGSAVTTVWLSEGYATGRLIPSEPEGFANAVERALERHAEWLGTHPLVIPVGDDHVRLADWLPAAADALRARRPDLQIAVGGWRDHLGHVEADVTVRGELRSPAFAPVLAGTASARVREKQAAARATTMLLRSAEPLAAWAAATGREVPRVLLQRAWRHLFHNQAHDSAAGCGSDETHADVRARYRWAEQLAVAARDQALAALRAGAPASGPFTLFHAGPASDAVTVEVEVPRACLPDHGGGLIARGPDGISRPAQSLDAVEERPLFEGEFAAAELGVYLNGLDPSTPLFGKFLTGITARPDGPGLVRLDVGLGERPVPPSQLAADQKRVGRMLGEAERFKVVLHGSGTTRRILARVGPAPEHGFVPFTVESGAAEMGDHARLLDGKLGIAAGGIEVAVEDDGTVTIRDGKTSLRANRLADEGDRGDLYHFDAIKHDTPIAARLCRARVAESGPLRAKLIVEQELELPIALSADRSEREKRTRTVMASTEITLHAGERRVEFATTFTNDVADHRLRAGVTLPFSAERLDADQGLAVVPRPLETAALGAGAERPAPTGQHQRFVDVSDGARGVALLSRGLPEHEVVRENGTTHLWLTLVRSVGWLARGDLSCVDHAVGPMVTTPEAQEPGLHRFEYALVLHEGDWERGRILDEARAYALPSGAAGGPLAGDLPPGRSLVEVTNATLLALAPSETGPGVMARLLNASAKPVEARVKSVLREATFVDPLERPRGPVQEREGSLVVPLGPWQLATILLR